MNCYLCHQSISLSWGICSECIRLLPKMCNDLCFVCGLPLFPKDKSCHHCIRIKPNWHRLIAVSNYEKPITTLIYQFKFYQNSALSTPLARLMFLKWYQARLEQKVFKPDIITCVPLHRYRYWQRGYNQSERLAEPISRWINAKFKPFLLSRNKSKDDQKYLSKCLRQQNVQHIFHCDENLQGKNIMLIDDIVTTGETIKAICEKLHNQGVNEIQILCLCRTNL